MAGALSCSNQWDHGTGPGAQREIPMLTWETVQVAQLDGYKYAITQEENGWAVDITDPDGGFDSTVCATIEEAKQYCENTAAEVQAEEE
jgi:hypothetical protein